MPDAQGDETAIRGVGAVSGVAVRDQVEGAVLVEEEHVVLRVGDGALTRRGVRESRPLPGNIHQRIHFFRGLGGLVVNGDVGERTHQGVERFQVGIPIRGGQPVQHLDALRHVGGGILLEAGHLILGDIRSRRGQGGGGHRVEEGVEVIAVVTEALEDVEQAFVGDRRRVLAEAPHKAHAVAAVEVQVFPLHGQIVVGGHALAGQHRHPLLGDGQRLILQVALQQPQRALHTGVTGVLP